MCGIWCCLGLHSESFPECIEKLKNRGPEYCTFKSYYGVSLGFTRLAINGLSAEGDQPFALEDGSKLVCNGEIYNHLALRRKYQLEDSGDGDCGILLHLIKKIGIANACREIDGVFAMIYVAPNYVYVARDPFGVRPLFHAFYEGSHIWSSEVKGLPTASKNVRQFPPGTYAVYNRSNGAFYDAKRYHTTSIVSLTSFRNPRISLYCLRESLYAAVEKRVLNTERPIAALLSGGLDSSLVAAIASSVIRYKGLPDLRTFSIGMLGSPDLKYAQKVADYIGSIHTSIIVTCDEFRDAVPKVILDIESYDITSVRASVGNWLVGKYIRDNTNCKVVLNGDGSDEIGGGYLYMAKAPTDAHFDAETLRLLNEIHMFDVLRSDRCMSAHGLEARTPFLDKQVVQSWLSIPTDLRTSHSRIEKSALREAFQTSELLPPEVLWRRKEAFSDGVNTDGATQKWYERPDEAAYYRELFDRDYAHAAKVIPHMWMPKWVDTTDPSATSYLSSMNN
jgi:asparagine synthase (glutamine-hydrolysing)